ncbi:HEPN domain-containing protein [Mucilaginibacter sp. 22184]|uniref:HEPN domain-containing protein n=1 Tax=Mucilaginibacter sp. 22184 TaxID=3453887 RepID=UPI003F8483C7
MKTSVEHLPQSKQEQIQGIVDVIKSVTKPEKIILYGSYARGTYQEDLHSKDGILYEYVSDFDILLIPTVKDLPEYEIQDRIVNRISYKAPVNVLIHYIDQVNEGLEKGQYFFTEILESGILLYDLNSLAFAEPRQLSSAERREIAASDFEFWFNNGKQFLFLAETLLANAIENQSKWNLVPHQLHQAVEAFYGAALLVFTGYKPKTHNLDKYRRYLNGVANEILKVFPNPANDKHELELFSLLKRAYIGGKYKKDFETNVADLNSLIAKVREVQMVVERYCLKKIKNF